MIITNANALLGEAFAPHTTLRTAQGKITAVEAGAANPEAEAAAFEQLRARNEEAASIRMKAEGEAEALLSEAGRKAAELEAEAGERAAALVLADTRAEDDTPEARQGRHDSAARVGRPGQVHGKARPRHLQVGQFRLDGPRHLPEVRIFPGAHHETRGEFPPRDDQFINCL